MSKAGRSMFKGANTQVLNAISLFLQFMSDSKFLLIELEGDNLEDFNLVFEDGKKIFCESKDRQEKFSYPQLKETLANVLSRKVFSEKDEILIICTNVNTEVLSDVEHSRYFEPIIDKLRDKGFTEEMLAIVPKVKFWQIPSSFNEDVIYTLFANLINFWLPEDDLISILDSILVQKIYKGSAKGSIYKRSELLSEIDRLATKVKSNSVYYNEKLDQFEDKFEPIEEALTKPNHPMRLLEKELSALSTDYESVKFIIDRLIGKKNELILQDWDSIWQLGKVGIFNSRILTIFENNLHTKDNQDYVLNSIEVHYEEWKNYYRYDFVETSIVDILKKVIEQRKDLEFLKRVIGIIRQLISYKATRLFYLKTISEDHNEYSLVVLSELLQIVFNLGDDDLKQEIFELISQSFNIVEDDSDFDHRSPKIIYAILYDWLNEDFKNRFPTLVELITTQYSKDYARFRKSKKSAFDGWELIGGGVGFFGSYHADDKHFISKILEPAIERYYAIDNEKGWEFVKENMLSKDDEVSISRPDFLNRATFEILLQRYSSLDSEISSEAFVILERFLQSKKGIPNKRDLIYQAITGDKFNLSIEQKWRLIQVTTKIYGIPVNPFVNIIVSEIARSGHKEAQAEMRRWLSNPDYFGNFLFGMEALNSSIATLLDTDSEFAIELFKLFLKSEYIKKDKGDHFDAFDISSILNKILKINYEGGVSILRELEAEPTLGKNQQLIYAYSLHDNRGNIEENKRDFLMKVYSDILNPLLDSLGNDIKKIVARFPESNAREAFVKFASKLAETGLITEALRVIAIFVNDPDPYLPTQNPDDPKDEYNEHKMIEEGKDVSTISAVRGYSAWVLYECAGLDGRDHLLEVFELTKKLLQDPNYHVISLACHPLEQLARNRLTVLPDDANRLFLNDDVEKALKFSKEIEGQAFELLEKLVSYSENVQKSIGKDVLAALNHIRALNETDALKLIMLLGKLSDELIEEAAPFFIFFAEYRKSVYSNWRFTLPHLYDDLSPEKYDEEKFRKILLSTIEALQKRNKEGGHNFAFHFRNIAMQKDATEDQRKKNILLAIKYFNILSTQYSDQILTTIYMTAEDLLESGGEFLEEWYELLMKCFKLEKDFYEEHVRAKTLPQVYWRSSFYHSRILTLVASKYTVDKFLALADVFFSFPLGVELAESDELVSVIENLSHEHELAENMIATLVKRDPSKYRKYYKKAKNQ